MAIFGKIRKGGDAGSGLGRGVGEGEGTVIDLDETGASAPSGVVIEGSSAPLPGPQSEAEQIVSDLSSAKPTREEKKAAAAAEKARRKAEKEQLKIDKAAAKASGQPIVKKSRKALKAEKDALDAEKDNHRLSNMVMVDFYPGMAKEDAIETARHWAMTHMDMPSLCYYYIMKIRDGYAIEVQEGVGRAYLPSIVELAQANPGRLIVVPMIRRKMTVFYSARLGEFEAQILPELQEPPAMPENPPIQAVRGPAMTPIMKQYREWLVAGAVTAGIGGLALLSSLTFYAFDSKAKVPPEWRTTDVALLPVMQWNRLQADAQDSYVTRLEFQDGQWRVVRQAVGASVDVAAPEATDSSGSIEGGVVPTAPGLPGSPGMAPGTMAPGPMAPPMGQAPSTGVPTNIPPPSGGPTN